MTISQVSSVRHDTRHGEYNSLVQVDADTYALAYTSEGATGWTKGQISTFTISADGTTISKVSSLRHEISSGEYSSLALVDSDIYALAYAGDENDGFLKTFSL